MQVEIKPINKVTKEVSITLNADRAEKEYLKSLNKAARNIQIQGFRKGKAPLNMVDRMYRDTIVEYFYKDIVDTAFDEAVKEHNISYLLMPEVKDIQWERGTEMKIVIELEHEPELTLNIPDHMDVPYQPLSIEDEVKKALENIAKENATVIDVEVSEDNDMLECELTLDPQGSKQVFTVRLFAGTSIPRRSFTELIGKKTGDVVQLNIQGNSLKLLTRENLADLDNETEYPCEVMINSVMRHSIPKVDDDFAKDMEFENLAAMEAKLAEDMRRPIDHRNLDIENSAIVSKLYIDNQFDLPTKTIEYLAAQQAERIEQVEYRKYYEYQYKMQYAQELVNVNILKALKQQIELEITDAMKDDYIEHEAALNNISAEAYIEKNRDKVESADFMDEVLAYNLLRHLATKCSFFIPEPEAPQAEATETTAEESTDTE